MLVTPRVPLDAGGASDKASERGRRERVQRVRRRKHAGSWLRTSGVNTSGAAEEEMTFDRLGKMVRPGTFGKIKVG